ncbi:MAG: hypothetical protein LBE18_01950 [Planctomycetaceae bacterium]|jgi:hypothetical protein|nr:hypothetical protein [Planctomycetaceae bacterium]
MNFQYEKYNSNRNFFIILFALFFILLVIFFHPDTIYADRFITKSGGEIEGEHLNINEIPYKTHRIKNSDGIEIEIDSAYIARKIPDKPISPLAEYNSFAPFAEDTIENHLKTADWCRQNSLLELSKLHLNLVLEKDTNHESARRLLGYTKDSSGIWISQEQRLIDLGLILTPKGWRTQQQIEVDKILNSRHSSFNRWQKELKSILKNLPSHPQSRQAILSITDPSAGPTIAIALTTERNPDTRILLIRALSNIGTSATIQEIARWSINQTETVTSVKRTCFDELRKHKEAYPILVGLYASQLNPQNGIYAINEAALAIAEFGGKSAVPQLIDVLVTIHTETQIVNPAGGIANRDTTGLQWGQPKEIKFTREIKNTGVLKALIALTGANFQYDKTAWKKWLIQNRKTQYFNARRGEYD